MQKIKVKAHSGKAKTPKVSFIVLNYNGEKHLKNCLDSINSQTYKNYEVIVVDNASKDNSWKICKNYDKIKLIKSKKNLGFAGGNNLGVKYCSGEYIAVFSHDAIAEKDWLKECMSSFKKDTSIAMVSGKIPLYSKKSKIWFSGGHIYPLGFVSNNYLGEQSGYCNFISGCAPILKKEVIDNLGFFDNRFFMYYEDVDLCNRFTSAKYKLFYNSDAVVYHNLEIGRLSKWETYFSNRNRVYSEFKKRKNFFSKTFFILADLFVGYQLYVLWQVKKRPAYLKFFKEIFRARLDSWKLCFTNKTVDF